MNPRKVVVGLSGGVDSSVAASMLVQQGYDVVGVMLRLWSPPGMECENNCCTPEAVMQARRVAARIGIPFYVVDAKDAFYETVVTEFLSEYGRGLTPNPCFWCNQTLRWPILQRYAADMDADYIATGHYARIERFTDGGIGLKKGYDLQKDQSYILSGIPRHFLAHTLFPLGEWKKKDVRLWAKGQGLEIAEKPDSQDLCFLGDQDIRQFLAAHLPKMLANGDIVDETGTVIGKHEGLISYTIGQRKGIKISADAPLYVIKKDLQNNRLIVGKKENLGSQDFTVTNINWLSDVDKNIGSIEVKIRYKAEPASAKIKISSKNEVTVHPDKLLRDVTPGQIAVLYSGELVLGGGIIDRVL
jgi:tRNA-specific 2-thiouridylase